MFKKEKQALTLTMLDVGQAECFLLEKGDFVSLIDCGKASKGNKIVESIRKRGIDKSVS